MFGPSFDYSRLPDLVSGRQGFGPVWVAWDTNVLVAYQQCGWQLWEGEDLPVVRSDAREIAALGELVATWMWWDLRFVPCRASMTDYGKPRPPAEVLARAKALNGLADALEIGLDGE